MSFIQVKRQEHKYFIGRRDIDALRPLLEVLMTPDPFMDNFKKQYTITSLYFDTVNDKDLDEKLDGLLERSKYRIRIYNHDTSVIKLERKSKKGYFIEKDSVLLSADCARKIISGDFDLEELTDSTINELLLQMKINGYKPRVIVEYDREAYMLPFGDIRVTFDKDLRTYNNYVNLFALGDMPMSPVFHEDFEIMEIKYRTTIPQHVMSILESANLTRSSISKYVHCQRYIDYSQWRDHLISSY